MISLAENYTAKLEKGDVIKFHFPYTFWNGKKLRKIQKNPSKKHYAIVIGNSEPILGKAFKGNDFVELTHGTSASPAPPFVSQDSFVEDDRENELVLNMFKNYPTSVPNLYDNKITVASIHKDAPIKNTVDFEYVGKVDYQTYKDFISLYKRKKQSMKQIVVDKKSNMYVVDRRKDKLNNGKQLSDRDVLVEAINNAEHYPEDYLRLLIL